MACTNVGFDVAVHPGRRFLTRYAVEMSTSRCSLYATLLAAACLSAQTPAPPPDTLVFTNGEKLIGHLVRSNGATVTFKSDSLGEVNVDWSKIQELHTSKKFVVVGKDVKLGRSRGDLS